MKTGNENRRRHSSKLILLILILGVTVLIPQKLAMAQNKVKARAPSSDYEQVNVDQIKEKYWARGNETELGVVQNRTFSKKGKVEFSLMTGVIYSDPFLNVNLVGGSVGYHLSEYLAFQVTAYRDLVSPSTALQTFQQTLGATTNTNMPRGYLGGEAMWSIFYGKLSVLGKSIIYYDFHVLGGLGGTDTESGTNITPTVGLGQRFYLSKTISVKLDYRLQYYKENIIEKQVITQLGQSRGTRDNWSNTITIGLGFMFF
jgi:outer membrane beta-barrel protein